MVEREIIKVEDSYNIGTIFSSSNVDFFIDHRYSNAFSGSVILFGSLGTENPVVVKIPRFSKDAEREWEGLTKAFAARVSVPEPIALIEFGKKQKAIMMKQIMGDKLYFNDDMLMRKKLGAMVFEMHSAVHIDKNNNLVPCLHYQEQLEKYKSFNSPGQSVWKTTNKLLSKLYPYAFENHNIKSVFNHNDLHEGQIIIEADGNLRILDFGNWKIDSNLNDIAYLLFHTIRTKKSIKCYECFLEGYFQNNCADKYLRNAIHFYTLFISARALEYFISTDSKHFASALNTHRDILKYMQINS